MHGVPPAGAVIAKWGLIDSNKRGRITEGEYSSLNLEYLLSIQALHYTTDCAVGLFPYIHPSMHHFICLVPIGAAAGAYLQCT